MNEETGELTGDDLIDFIDGQLDSNVGRDKREGMGEWYYKGYEAEEAYQEINSWFKVRR